MTLKGLPDPVDTVEVMWEPLVTAESRRGGPVAAAPDGPADRWTGWSRTRDRSARRRIQACRER